MNIVATGCLGFIGSNWVNLRKKTHPEDRILIIDKKTYAGSLHNIEIWDEQTRIIRADVVDIANHRRAIEVWKPDLFIHMAAESHVDNSIADASPFVHTNVSGTVACLELCRQLGIPFCHISTDECVKHYSPNQVSIMNGLTGEFGSKLMEFYRIPESPYKYLETNIGKLDKGIHEVNEFDPSSPYSASKAAGEMFCNAYKKTYGMEIDIVRPTNNYGPRQHGEKFIPTILRSIFEGKKIPIYGKGENFRDWLFVEDFCHAFNKIIEIRTGKDIWHVSAQQERKNIDVVMEIIGKLGGRHYDLIEYVEDRPGHDFCYSLDSSKLRSRGWSPKVDFSEGLNRTIAFYQKEYENR